MRLFDRFIVAMLAMGLWAFAVTQMTKPQANAAYELTRYEVAAVMRDVLKQSKPVTAQEMRTILNQVLAHCQITGHLSDEENSQEDAIDFRARLQC